MSGESQCGCPMLTSGVVHRLDCPLTNIGGHPGAGTYWIDPMYGAAERIKEFLAKLDADIRRCDHGYISVTCADCMAQAMRRHGF